MNLKPGSLVPFDSGGVVTLIANRGDNCWLSLEHGEVLVTNGEASRRQPLDYVAIKSMLKSAYTDTHSKPPPMFDLIRIPTKTNPPPSSPVTDYSYKLSTPKTRNQRKAERRKQRQK
jgi:hypothetical protein